MKMKSNLALITLTSALISASLMLPAQGYAGAFFETGKTYLFIPRIDVVIKGTVVEVTDHEVVFTDRHVLKASKSGGRQKIAAVKAYLDSDNKQSLLERSIITQDVSYSRAHMSAIKLAD